MILGKWAFGFGLFVSVAAQAGEARIIGSSEVSHPVELVELNVTVHSECYSTPQLASQATDKLSEKVVAELERHLIPSEDRIAGVITLGGYTQPFVRYGDGQTYCVGSFQKRTPILFRTTRVEDFESIFNQIQSALYDLSAAPIERENAKEEPLAYITLAQPQPQVSDETLAEMVQQALNQAMEEALQKFEASQSPYCPVHFFEVTEVKELLPAEDLPITEKGSSLLSDEASSSEAPVRFDLERVKKTLAVTFRYEGGRCTRP